MQPYPVPANEHTEETRNSIHNHNRKTLCEVNINVDTNDIISSAIAIEVMAHSLTMAAGAAASAKTAISRRRDCYPTFPIPACASAPDEASPEHHSVSLPRRTLIISGTILLGLSLSDHSQNARAAARRPPPSPSEEKRDPNVSGVQAKVLASKRRKEAMKQTVAKLREKGNLVEQPPQ